jgi:hypothetical protein
MLLPADYLSTNGNQIVDAAGTLVRLVSLRWNQNLTSIPGTVESMAAAGIQHNLALLWR